MTNANKSHAAATGNRCQKELTTDAAFALVLKAAKALGDGRRVRVLPERRDTMVEAISILKNDRRPDAQLTTALNIPHLSSRAECCSMIEGRLGLREPTGDCFAEEGSR